jgi:Zn-dependent protease
MLYSKPSKIVLAGLFNIMRIRFNYTWIFVITLVTAIVTTQFSEDYNFKQRIILGLVVSLLYLAAVTVRELVLSTTALRTEFSIKKITIFAFGGVYQEIKDRTVSTHLPLLYLTRYLSNLVIAIVFYGLYATFINAGNQMIAGVFQWLSYIFFLLFLLHFIPVFPLDAGQILRMVLWRFSGNYYTATHISSLIGWAVGLFSMFAGVLVFIINQQWMISFILLIIGWIIQVAAGNIRSKIKTLIVLEDIRAQDIMTREYPVMPPQVNIGQLVREHILKKGWSYIIVMESTQLKGVVTIERIKSVPWKRWNTTTLGDILTPYGQTMTALPLQTADTLFDEMDQRQLDYIPVLADGHIIGVVTRLDLIGLVKIRAGFGL